jgi:beta-phosphoglucomutase-like phosphatase (HAD superfamily)
MSSPLSAVLFDFDGTLATYKSHLGLYVSAAAEYGITVTEADLAATLEDSWGPWLTARGVDHSAHSATEALYNAEVRSRLHVARLAGAGATGDLDAVAATPSPRASASWSATRHTSRCTPIRRPPSTG